jgi:hypothetical protein
VGLSVLRKGHGSIDGEDFCVPIKLGKILKELLEDVQWGFQLRVEIVQEKDHDDVERVGGHVGCVGSEQGCVVGEPALEEED